MNKFLPTTHATSNMRFIGALCTGVFLLNSIPYYYKLGINIISIISVLLAIMCPVAVKRLDQMGVIFSGAKIHERTFFKMKLIDPAQIVAIKKSVQLTQNHLYGPFVPLKDKQGNLMYNMFFVRKIDAGMPGHDGGDVRFLHDFRKWTICVCIYDQEAIDYLLTLNPNIVVWQ